MTRSDRIDRVVAAVCAVDGVIGLHTAPGVPSSYLPGRIVGGVRLSDSGGTVHVVVELGIALLETAQRVRDAASVAAGVPVDVVVGDVAAGDAAATDASSSPSPRSEQ
ncbi:hypothetical protein L2K20_25055 [Mycobacterium sp. MBM]|nr:hypothetical protein [Mycobacterium sp. MBM]